MYNCSRGPVPFIEFISSLHILQNAIRNRRPKVVMGLQTVESCGTKECNRTLLIGSITVFGGPQDGNVCLRGEKRNSSKHCLYQVYESHMSNHTSLCCNIVFKNHELVSIQQINAR